ncbi:hypothetical protein BHE74_00024749 [Ensete ventricosum]|nr:hypothetical protein GW17_00005147 [Ensete ventricosum]RWW67774.1 hypothetical protein BHE74_00024749 [Ensete ventricosum]RZR78651.1 hypothetical protein BHM03_00004069 [Ensete ventricosum]
MVSFRDGRYAVDYVSSISLLQAFAICIAIHHGRKPTNYSAEPKSYVPNHPPLSPVGRA